jgi:hypothetical protein
MNDDEPRFYDQRMARTPEDYRYEPDPSWGECRKCGRQAHLYSEGISAGTLCRHCDEERRCARDL